LWVCMDAREIDAARVPQHRCEDLGATDRHDLVDAALGGTHFSNLERFLDAASTLDTGHAEVGFARDDDIVAPVERLADRVIGLATHDHGLAHGKAAEDLQVGGHTPRNGALAPDHTILGDRDDEGDDETHGSCLRSRTPSTSYSQLASGMR